MKVICRLNSVRCGLIPIRVSMLLLGAMALSASAQDRPTRRPSPSTPEQDQAIRAAVELHDQRKYDEAIAGYLKVLDANPDNVTALYELAYSYAAKNDYVQSLEIGRRGADYDSDLLGLFYDVQGFALDAMGEPREAIEAYRRGVALVPDPGMLYYNMGVTYLESLQDEAGARAALEQSSAADPTHPPTELLLGEVFQRGGYTTPALLALSKYLMLEPAGRSSVQGYGLWRIVLRGGADDSRGGLAPAPALGPAKTDEGDFTTIDAAIAASHTRSIADRDGGATEIRALVDQVDSIFGLLAERAVEAPGFVDRHYVPFFAEMMRRNFVEPFVYWASQRGPVVGVQEWITRNRPRVEEFVAWAKAYDWQK